MKRIRSTPRRDRQGMARAARIFAVLGAALLLGGCGQKTQTLGFIGGLSGKGSDLGISGRDGAALAVNELNEAGGIRGKSVRFAAADDLSTEEGARAAFETLRKAGARVIVGPMTSAMSLAILDRANGEKILLISPTASSKALTGLDDWFTRVNPPDVSEARDLAMDAKNLGVTRALLILDLSNEAYSRGEAETFRQTFAPFGAVEELEFTSGDSVSYTDIAKRALGANCDGIVIVANTVDTAGICQAIRKTGSQVRLWSTGWAMTSELVTRGGSSVEGLRFSHYFDAQSTSPVWISFRDRYRAQYGTDPDFFAGLAWVSARIALKAMEQSDDPESLRSWILTKGPFEGLQGSLKIDAFGDADLERFPLEVKNGKITGIR